MAKREDKEIIEILDEYVDDPEYFYNNPLKELDDNIRCKRRLKIRNIILIAIFSLIVIVSVGMWRTLTYGKLENGKYVYVTNERENVLEYIEKTDLIQEEIDKFINNVQKTNRETAERNNASARIELYSNKIIEYQKWLEEIEKEKYFANKTNEEKIKRYNKELISTLKTLIEILENEKLYQQSGYEDYIEENGVPYGKVNNYLTCKTDENFLITTNDKGEKDFYETNEPKTFDRLRTYRSDLITLK